MWFKIVTALTASWLLAMNVAAASADEMAGLWEAWRVVDGRRVKLNSSLYRLKDDGRWTSVRPGSESEAGTFTVEDASLTLSLLDNGKVADKLVLAVQSPQLMRGSDGDMEVEFVRHAGSREAALKVVPGEWNVFMIIEGDEKDELRQLPFYFVFAGDGTWRSGVTDADSGLQPEEGTYVIDNAGFLIVSNDLGGEIVFTYSDSRLKGWGADSDKFCVKR